MIHVITLTLCKTQKENKNANADINTRKNNDLNRDC